MRAQSKRVPKTSMAPMHMFWKRAHMGEAAVVRKKTGALFPSRACTDMYWLWDEALAMVHLSRTGRAGHCPALRESRVLAARVESPRCESREFALRESGSGFCAGGNAMEPLSGGAPRPKHLLVAEVNHCIVNLAQSVNQFATKCDHKLLKLHARLKRLDREVKLIEFKIHHLTSQTNNHDNDKAFSHDHDTSHNQQQQQPQVELTTRDADEIEPLALPQQECAPEVDAASVKAKDDPRLEKYLKMLRVGVGMPQVMSKLQMEMPGVDASFLENPEVPSPLG